DYYCCSYMTGTTWVF
nr:immunoglobulin light chain junction region [Macaca mulatta]MOV99913.1 immunoglobulin light chain junction region [Macaca mulatta]